MSTPYMDEAARCTRLGFMREGRLLVDGTPSRLLSRLEGRILELRGSPLGLLRTVAVSTEGIEDARMFGDRIHIRTALDSDVELENRLRARAAAEGAEITSLRPIRPQLEDVFISLIQ